MFCIRFVDYCFLWTGFATTSIDDKRIHKEIFGLEPTPTSRIHQILAQTVENLMDSSGGGGKTDPCILTGQAFNEKVWIEKSEEAENDLEAILFWLFKAFIALYLGEYDKCSEFMTNVFKQNLNICSSVMFQQINFIAALVDVLVAREEKTTTTTKIRWKRIKSKRKFGSAMVQLQTYGKLGPVNIMNKIYLIEAEKAVLKDDRAVAKAKFRMSIDHANQQEFVHEEALAYERYAIAMLEWGEVSQALEYFERARSLYDKWGSMAKVKRLEEFVREKCGVSNTTWK